jgi:hypothetical protein
LKREQFGEVVVSFREIRLQPHGGLVVPLGVRLAAGQGDEQIGQIVVRLGEVRSQAQRGFIMDDRVGLPTR